MSVAAQLSPEVDPVLMRRLYADLAYYDDAALGAHFDAYGRTEGRTASDDSTREGLIARIGTPASMLEIGPFCQPVFRGPHVRYLDVLTAEELGARAREIGLDPSGCPEEIHYHNGLGEAAGAAFDVIFSSHNFEHQPDPIRHLNDAAAALAPEGVYAMLIPDRRFCFDHFLAETTIADVLEAYVERRARHAPRHVIEHIALTCHNDPAAHWRGEHGPRPLGDDGRLGVALEKLAAAGDDYIDVHAWHFTPMSFRELMQGVAASGLSRMRPLRVYDTPHGRSEFVAVLQVSPSAI
ncbi:hypothetical protein [Brevundimonas sp. TWP2-3-2]|uniref:hypothetical protein n=1 Tax=unclassified Brevundimonas TaxID=2622653 RepID=UPI003CEC722B